MTALSLSCTEVRNARRQPARSPRRRFGRTGHLCATSCTCRRWDARADVKELAGCRCPHEKNARRRKSGLSLAISLTGTTWTDAPDHHVLLEVVGPRARSRRSVRSWMSTSLRGHQSNMSSHRVLQFRDIVSEECAIFSAERTHELLAPAAVHATARSLRRCSSYGHRQRATGQPQPCANSTRWRPGVSHPRGAMSAAASLRDGEARPHAMGTPCGATGRVSLP